MARPPVVSGLFEVDEIEVKPKSGDKCELFDQKKINLQVLANR